MIAFQLLAIRTTVVRKVKVLLVSIRNDGVGDGAIDNTVILLMM